MDRFPKYVRVIVMCGAAGLCLLMGVAVGLLLRGEIVKDAFAVFSPAVGACVGAAFTVYIAQRRADRERLAEKAGQRLTCIAEMTIVVDAIERLLAAATNGTNLGIPANGVFQAIGNRWSWLKWLPGLSPMEETAALNNMLAELHYRTSGMLQTPSTFSAADFTTLRDELAAARDRLKAGA